MAQPCGSCRAPLLTPPETPTPRHAILFEEPNTIQTTAADDAAMKILVAPSGFKESLGPERIADAIEAGIHKALEGKAPVYVRKLPVHDGGEGFCRALVAATDGHIMGITVTGPVGQKVHSHLGFMYRGSGVAILDMAAAAGLRLVPKNLRDPTVTTTYGVGELIKAALDSDCDTIIIGCGDSGTSDGGAGMLQALGARLLDGDGMELPNADGGRSLMRLENICWCGIHPRLRLGAVDRPQIVAVCNVANVLCGPKGVARMYAPQKGAGPEEVLLLEKSLERLGQVATKELGEDISHWPGSGASGGLGTGLLLLGSTLYPRKDAINQFFGLYRVFDDPWDLVITAEGSLDGMSAQGKMTTEVAKLAQSKGIPVVAVAGSIGEGAESCYTKGIDAFTSVMKEPTSLEQAIAETELLVQDGAEKAVRMVMVGYDIARARGVIPQEQRSWLDMILPEREA